MWQVSFLLSIYWFYCRQRLQGQKEQRANTIKMFWVGRVIKKSYCVCSLNLRDAYGYVENTAAQWYLWRGNEAEAASLTAAVCASQQNRDDTCITLERQSCKCKGKRIFSLCTFFF